MDPAPACCESVYFAESSTLDDLGKIGTSDNLIFRVNSINVNEFSCLNGNTPALLATQEVSSTPFTDYTSLANFKRFQTFGKIGGVGQASDL